VAAPWHDPPVLLHEIARTWEAVSATSARLEKGGRLADLLTRLRPDEVEIAVAYLAGELPQGTVGVGWASLRDLPPPLEEPGGLELRDVDEVLDRIAVTVGAGSQARRRGELAALFGRASRLERDFLVRLLMGELRQGALQGVMVEALARAARVPVSDVRRAAMLAGDLGPVARAVLTEGGAGLSAFRLTVLSPVGPMLAQTAPGLPEAFERIRPAAVEWKLDGARIQVHRLEREIRVFTRNLADVSHRVPEVVEAVDRLSARAAVLDGEAIALRADGRPYPFQATMSRFGSRLEVDDMRRALPLSAFFFDCLHLEGDDLLDRTGSERAAALATVMPEELRVPRRVSDDADAAESTLDAALARGHEGVMVKSLTAPYEAGRRGAGWLKVKRTHTLDLVILAAEWGHGRRRGWLSNLHLGARDPSSGRFVMLGKTFKGLTDEMLQWQTRTLLELETHRDGIVVFVRPQVVVEIAFDGVQDSSRYPGGIALRFARVRGYRLDKSPDHADTVDAVRALKAGAPRG
jgi:DNA ligase-1